MVDIELLSHHEILRSAIESNNGYVFQIIGDAFCASFHTAGDAIRAAALAQTRFYNEDWGEAPVKIRIGINTGTAQASIDTDHSGGYKGYTAMARVQRIMSAGHGGQVLISRATEELIRDELPENVTLRDMGERRFKDLNRSERIHQLVIAHLPAEFPPIKTLDAYQHNLPVQLTSFIGREDEMVNIAQIIKEHPLVTLTGVGGTGKTRLALQVSADLLDEFTGGIWFVDFASLINPKLIPQTVVSTLQLHELPGRAAFETITDFLGTREALLLLDNCEHLIQECAEFSNHLLQKCTKLKILTTTREPLGILGEVILSVASLSTPESSDNPLPLEEIERFEAVELFVDRACMVHPSFKLTPTNALSVAKICTRLDGIPLALELAAARVRGMGVDQIASRLDQRFRLLTGGSRTAMQRQQTLSATIDWSYNLLTDEEKQLFQMLAVFIGPHTLEAAEEVCRIEDVDVLEISDLLQRLVEKSLVITEERYGETYYRLLETIRQYGRDKLLASEKAELVADYHASYFKNLANQASIELRGLNQILWTDRFITMHDNLLAALEWVTETGEAEAALHFVNDLFEFWLRHSAHEEARQWHSRILALPDAQQYPEAYLEAYNHLTLAYWLQRKIKEARTFGEQALILSQSQTSTVNTAVALLNLGVTLLTEKEPDKAQDYKAQGYIEEAKDLCQEHQHEWELARAHMLLGMAYKNRDQYTSAHSHYSEAFNLWKKLGDIGFQCVVQWVVGDLEIEQGNLNEAINEYCESLLIARAVKNHWTVANIIRGLAIATKVKGDYTRAIRLYLASKKILENLGAWWSGDEPELEEELAIARTALDESAFNAAVEQGHAMSMEQAIEYALEVSHE